MRSEVLTAFHQQSKFVVNFYRYLCANIQSVCKRRTGENVNFVLGGLVFEYFSVLQSYRCN